MSILATILLALGFLVALTMLEGLRNPARTDWRRNLQCWLLDFAVAFVTIKFWPDWHGGSLFHASAMPFWLALPTFLLVRDFTEWLFHYAQHRIPVLWSMHSLHHSDPEMTALTTNRHFWADRLVKSLTIWPFATMILAPTNELLGIYAAVSFYTYFFHANLKVDFGRWSWLLNCPAYHRLHHSRLAAHQGTNFAALFPIFDVVFGTYRRPEGWPPCGLDRAPRSFKDLLTWAWDERPARSRAQQAGEGLPAAPVSLRAEA